VASSGPMGPARRRCSGWVVAEEGEDRRREVSIGETVRIPMIDQGRAPVSIRRRTLWEVVVCRARSNQGGHRGDALEGVRERVRFQGPDQQKPAGVLSGGERNRLTTGS